MCASVKNLAHNLGENQQITLAMKKDLHWILPIGMILLFAMCRKEIKTQQEIDAGKFKLAAAAIAAYDWEFNTNGNFEGWTWANATVAVSGGSLNLATTTTDPLLLSPDNLGITAPKTYKFIQVNMKNNSSVTGARIFFTTTADTVWSQAKSKGFAINANTSSYASYIVDMSTVAGWSGTIKRIRIDPLDPAGGSGQTVNIDLIRITETITNVNDWGFDAEGNFEGWTWGNASAAVTGGTLNLTATGADPLLFSPDYLGITAPATYKFVHVDMKNYSSDTSARIFFITDADTVWNSAKSKRFTIKADPTYYGSYIVDMSTVAGWSGTIRRIRVDPLDPASNGQSVKIDFIRITNNQSYRGVMSPQGSFTAADADALKNTWKANVMRWQLNNPTDTPATVNDYDAWLDRRIVELDNAFSVCEPIGIKILIDMHLTPGGGFRGGIGTMIFYDKAANDKIIASWYKLANRYKGRSGLYGYDLMNEPQELQTPTAGCDFRTTVNRIGDTIRGIDRKTPIFVAAEKGDNPYGFSFLTPFPFTNIVYETHMYEPHEYTLQRRPHTNDTATYIYPGYVGTTYYNKAQLTTSLKAVHDFQASYSARIHVGEFSAVRWADGAATWLRDCIDIFEGYGWSWTYHAYKESDFFDLNIADTPIRPIPTGSVFTDRYNQVVGYGMNLNQ